MHEAVTLQIGTRLVAGSLVMERGGVYVVEATGADGELRNAKVLAYTKAQASDMLNISLRTLNRLIERGDLRVVHAGRRVLIPHESIAAYLERDSLAEAQQAQGEAIADALMVPPEVRHDST